MKRFFRIAALAAVVFCVGCGENGQGSSPWEYVDTAMGTVILQSIYAPQDTAQAFAGEAMSYLDGLEREKISWRLDTSEVYQINASAGSGEGCLLSEDMAELLESCMEMYESSEGAFDITLGTLVRLWDIDEWASREDASDFVPPSPEAVGEALSLCGGGRLLLTQDGEARLYMPEGMQLDLGAAGKGLALSGLWGMLQERQEITGAVISLGGSILTCGEKPDGSSWKVGVTDPFDSSSNVGILSLEGQWCVSTSGDYERYVELDGVRYHHILDPSSGYPADAGVRGVTVLSKDGLLSDMLSTACFILGPEKGQRLAEQYGAETLFVLSDGELVLSEGMKACFVPSR